MIRTSLIAQGKRQLFMSLFLAILVSLVYFQLARFYQGQVPGWILAIGWVAVLINLLRAGLGLAYRLDRHPFRSLDLGLVDDQAPPGGSFQIDVRLEARRHAVLRRLVVELRSVRSELVEGERRETQLYRDDQVMANGLELGPGDRKELSIALSVLPDVPYSYRSMEGRIRWTLHVTVDVDDWGTLVDEIEVLVAPGRGGRGGRDGPGE